MLIPTKFEAGAINDAATSTQLFRDIADDLAAVAGALNGVTAAAAAVTAVADVAAVAAAAPAAAVVADANESTEAGAGALANELKAKYNVMVTAVAELRTLAGTVRSLVNDIKAKYNASVTLQNELRSDAPSSATLKTTNA